MGKAIGVQRRAHMGSDRHQGDASLGILTQELSTLIIAAKTAHCALGHHLLALLAAVDALLGWLVLRDAHFSACERGIEV